MNVSILLMRAESIWSPSSPMLRTWQAPHSARFVDPVQQLEACVLTHCRRIIQVRNDLTSRLLVKGAYHIVIAGLIGCNAADIKSGFGQLKPNPRLGGPKCRQLQGDRVESGLVGLVGDSGRMHFLFKFPFQNYTSGRRGHQCGGDVKDYSQKPIRHELRALDVFILSNTAPYSTKVMGVALP